MTLSPSRTAVTSKASHSATGAEPAAAGELYGRAVETSLIGESIESAVGGRASVLAFVGPPGCGKTSLLRYAAERAAAAEVGVVSITGTKGEAGLALSGVVSIVRPHRRQLPALPAEAAGILGAALGEGGTPPLDRLSLGVALLTLLASVAEQSPLCLLVDDAQWLDRMSLQALSFALQRLDFDRIAALLAVRSEQPTESALPIATHTIPGLGADDVRALMERRSGRQVAVSVAAAVAQGSDGNPLAVGELARVLTDEHLAGTAPLPDPLPLGPATLGPATLSPFRATVAALPGTTRRALTIVAAAGSAAIPVISAALEQAGLALSDLAPARASAVLVADSIGRLEFVHPLMRTAILSDAGESSRRAHALLAAAYAGVDVERHAWHLAAAADGSSDAVATALERAAVVAASRGGHAAAAEALSRAVELSPAGESREIRSLQAANALFLAGRRRAAVRIYRDLLGSSDRERRAEAALALVPRY